MCDYIIFRITHTHTPKAGGGHAGWSVATDLFEQPSLLNDIRDGFLSDAMSLEDVFEGVEVVLMPVLDGPDLQRV